MVADGIRKLGRIEAKDAAKKERPAPPLAKVKIALLYCTSQVGFDCIVSNSHNCGKKIIASLLCVAGD